MLRPADRPSALALAALALPLLAAPAAGQDTLRSLHVDVSLSNPFHIAIGDLDEDGFDDFAVAGSSTRTVLNLDGSSFALSGFHGGGAADVALADVDGDGHLDLLQARPFNPTHHVRVNLGNGDGSFGPDLEFPTAFAPRDISVVDVDADGVLDLVVPCEDSDSVSVLLGLGDGTFAPKLDVGPTADRPRWATVADLDGDDVLDIAALSYPGDLLTIFPGLGDGTFAAPLPAFSIGTQAEALRSADFDADGNADLVVVDDGPYAARVLFGNGDATFPREVLVPLGFLVGELVIADLDEDGTLDLAASIAASQQVGVALGLGDGTFAPTRYFGTGRAPFTIAAGDFNGDGDLDLATANTGTDDVTVLLGEGDGNFHPNYSTGSDPRGTAVGDLDGDGLPDLAVANELSDSVGVLLNQGNGRYQVAASVLGIGEPTDVVLGDFDGDGLTDLLVTSGTFFGHGVFLVPGHGDGTFGAPQGLGLQDQGLFLETADFDGDGQLDAVVALDGPSGMTVLLFDGAGGIKASLDLGIDSWDYDVAVGDLNADGLPDIAMSSEKANPGVALHLNHGAGFLPVVIAGGAPSSMGQIVLADLDLDGDDDVILEGGTGAHGAAVMLSNGDGTLQPFDHYGVTFTSYAVAAADVTADGVPDLLVTAHAFSSSDESQLHLFVGLGDGTFDPAPQTIRVGREAERLTIADVDLDGVDDVLVSAAAGNHVAVLLSRAGPWETLGDGLAGTPGIPRLIGEGPLVEGELLTLTLRDALPFAPTSLIVGLSELSAPYKGGVMVPSVDVLIAPVFPDAEGTFVIAAPWVAAPSGLELWFQCWVTDAGGPKNRAASPAVKATVP